MTNVEGFTKKKKKKKSASKIEYSTCLQCQILAKNEFNNGTLNMVLFDCKIKIVEINVAPPSFIT